MASVKVHMPVCIDEINMSVGEAIITLKVGLQLY